MKYKFEASKYTNELISIFNEIHSVKQLSDTKLRRILAKYPKDGNSLFTKHQLIKGFDYLKKNKHFDRNRKLPTLLQMKPTRTISGVTTVTVLTKPYACPGKCIFCPNDVRMPKSYIATEPGAQRALMNKFSPYLQVYNRLQALKNIGHPTDKIELLVLGGTWSYYPQNYQRWFIKECFRAMNDFSIGKIGTRDRSVDIKEELKHDYNEEIREEVGELDYNHLIHTEEFKDEFNKYIVKEAVTEWEEVLHEQMVNVSAKSRCVGLVLETRPDAIREREVLNLRRLGATKIQIGIQTLNDRVSEMNKRGETKEMVAKAFKLLRAAGFKIHAHLMPNLYGATPEIDYKVYQELFGSPEYRPDELKIYPTSVIKNTELFDIHAAGKHRPYTTHELTDLLAKCMETTPEYCRITRVIRDIPSTEIEAGNKTTNLREVVEWKLKKEGRPNPNIRAREIKGKEVSEDSLKLDIIKYRGNESDEYFLQYITDDRKIAGFLRLSVPDKGENPITEELNNSGIIREIHVYGPSLKIGSTDDGKPQHIGLGTKLIGEAVKITSKSKYTNLAVISAIGTREYYRKRGFNDGQLYQHLDITRAP